MTTLANGSLSLYDPNDPLDFGNLSLINYQLTASSPATTVGTNLMSHSGLNTKSLNNMGWLVPENGSELQIGTLTGSGDITAVGGTVVIAGTAPSSETIGLVDNSNLYLGDDWTYGFSATVDMDASSTIHFYDPKTFTDPGSMLGGQAAAAAHIQGLLSDLAVVHSLTPGYAPAIQYLYGPGGGIPGAGGIVGMEIVDKPIIPSTTSATDTIVGSTVVNPTGSISATKGSKVQFNTSSAPTSDTISLDGTSTLLFVSPVGMNFLAPINMVSGSTVAFSSGIQGSGIPSSITEYPKLNLVDFYSGSTLEAQLHIHNESPGTTIWAANGFKGVVTLTDSVSQPANQAGAGYPPDVAVPIHLVG